MLKHLSEKKLQTYARFVSAETRWKRYVALHFLYTRSGFPIISIKHTGEKYHGNEKHNFHIISIVSQLTERRIYASVNKPSPIQLKACRQAIIWTNAGEYCWLDP